MSHKNANRKILRLESLEHRQLLSVSPQPVSEVNQGGSPYLDIQSDNIWLGDDVLFAAGDGSGDVELWKSDGTSEGTVRVKDIRTGAASSLPRDFMLVSDRVLFTAYSDAFGRELWLTDGTEHGTVLVKDLALGPASPTLDHFTSLNGEIYFRNNHELWSTDGTADGTTAITTTEVELLTPLGEELFFRADIGSGQQGLWISDGTAEGTTLLSGEAVPDHMVAVGDLLFFQSDHDLWRSDGTTDGTRRLRSFSRGPSGLTAVGDQLFFSHDGRSDGSNFELWRSDGTTAGTERIKRLPGWPHYFKSDGDKLVFNVNQNGTWSSDGTPEGTQRDAEAWSTLNAVAENFFVRTDGNGRDVLWYSDKINGDINPVPGMQNVDVDKNQIREMNGVLYAVGKDDHGNREVWRTDGSAAKTQFLGNEIWVMAANDKSALIWSTSDTESQGLWALNEGEVTPSKIHDKLFGPSQGTMIAGFLEPTFFHVGDNLIYAENHRLWRHDGTHATQIESAPEVSYPSHDTPIVQEHAYFFSKADAEGQAELWRTDGSDAGTVRLLESDERISGPWNLTSVGDTLYFMADNRVWKFEPGQTQAVEVDDFNRPPISFNGDTLMFRHGAEDSTELWIAKSNEQEQLLAVVPGNYIDTRIADNQVFVSVDNGELWRTDGTAEGTYWLVDEFDHFSITVANDRVFFLKEVVETGKELWVSDGTRRGTHLTRDIVPGGDGCSPANMVALEGTLYFSAVDASGTQGLWKSDGTSEGTSLVKQVEVYPIAAGDGVIYMDGIESSSGREIWKSDGTKEGTVKIVDLNAGPADARRGKTIAAPPAAMVIEFNNRLYFTGDDGFHGYELWQIPTNSETPSVPGDANRDGRFDSSDLVQVFQRGEYEDRIDDNSLWEDGDWNGDGDFTTADLVFAFQAGEYQAAIVMHAVQANDMSAIDWQNDTKRKERMLLDPDSTDEMLQSL